MKQLIAFGIMAFIITSCSKDAVEPKQVASSDEEDVVSSVLIDSVLYKNSFNKNTQGWQIVGDAQGSSVEPTYESSGGNPGGYISATDDVAGGIWYFSASTKFLNNVKDKYGKILKFQLKQSGTDSQFNARDLVIEGNGLLLYFDTDHNPGTIWTRYAVPLKAGRWLKEDNTAPTRNEMNNALKNITKLWIRGEYITGADVGGIDNVAIVERIDE